MFELTKHCRIIENHVFFLKGPFSQWWQAEIEENGIVFNCSEQYMMYRKAILFNDRISAQKILSASTLREQKRLGSLVKNFDTGIWDACQTVDKVPESFIMVLGFFLNWCYIISLC